MRVPSIVVKATRSRAKQHPLISVPAILSRSFSQLFSPSKRRCGFGIAFDIDGVVLRGESPIGGSPQAIRRLYDNSGALNIPFIFLTNGGGFPESKRALELSRILDINILPLQIVQGHSPFKQLVNLFKNDLIVAVGKGEPAAVMSGYGFKNVLSIDDYSSYFDGIDPLAQHKKWTTKQTVKQGSTSEMALQERVHTEKVKAAFIVSDSVDWSRDIQVLCDILRTGGLPGREIGDQPHLYFANDDLAYQYTSYGKPNPSVFRNAEAVLKQLVSLQSEAHPTDYANTGNHHFKRLYMIGDNPSVDIKGAREAGDPWFSILTRTGVFKGTDNHAELQADLVVDTVEDAVDYILKSECA